MFFVDDENIIHTDAIAELVKGIISDPDYNRRRWTPDVFMQGISASGSGAPG